MELPTASWLTEAPFSFTAPAPLEAERDSGQQQSKTSNSTSPFTSLPPERGWRVSRASIMKMWVSSCLARQLSSQLLVTTGLTHPRSFKEAMHLSRASPMTQIYSGVCLFENVSLSRVRKGLRGILLYLL